MAQKNWCDMCEQEADYLDLFDLRIGVTSHRQATQVPKGKRFEICGGFDCVAKALHMTAAEYEERDI